MNRIRPEVDIVLDILKAVMEARPDSSFVHSLHHQYLERGGLSRKQLEGLHQKASKVETIAPNLLATLEAIIMKKPTRYKSDLPKATSLYEKDEKTGQMLEAILAKHPQHKRILFLHSKFQNNEPFQSAENTELLKFYRLLV